MLKKNIFVAFVLMLISIFLLTTIPTYASAEESYDTNYTPKRTTKKRTTKKSVWDISRRNMPKEPKPAGER